MEAKATAKYVRMSPSKLKPVTDLVRGKDLNEALTILKFTSGTVCCRNLCKPGSDNEAVQSRCSGKSIHDSEENQPHCCDFKKQRRCRTEGRRRFARWVRKLIHTV